MQAGDVLFFHFCGHTGQVMGPAGHYEECILLSDYQSTGGISERQLTKVAAAAALYYCCCCSLLLLWTPAAERGCLAVVGGSAA